MALPAHYPAFYKKYLKFAVVMTFVAMLSGILFQESAKKAPYSAALPAGIHLDSVIHLALLHGHVFLIGVLIPVAILGMLQLSYVLDGEPVSSKTLKWGTWLYIPGAVLTVVLMLYKGYHFLMAVRMGQLDFQSIEQSYFFGIVGLRHALYALSHIATAFGLGTLVVGVWKSLPKTPAFSESKA